MINKSRMFLRGLRSLAKKYGHDPTAYCIITRGRTGSNLLLSLLDSNPAIRNTDETIGERVLRQDELREQIVELGAVNYVKQLLRRQGFESLVGLKFLYYQVEREYAEGWQVSDLPEVVEFLRGQRRIRIIHLKRRNRLQTLASIEVAARTRQWVLCEGEQPADYITISLSPERCEQEFVRIGEWEREFDQIFQLHPFLHVDFEDLVSSMDQECRRIQEFLGVPLRRLQTKMRKQNTRSMDDIIENYSELKGHFSGSEWADFFTE